MLQNDDSKKLNLSHHDALSDAEREPMTEVLEDDRLEKVADKNRPTQSRRTRRKNVRSRRQRRLEKAQTEIYELHAAVEQNSSLKESILGKRSWRRKQAAEPCTA